MSPSSSRPRRRHADSRLPDILDAAARLFRERGYHATSVRDVASRVGILPGSLYCHFASKEDLLVAVYEEGVERMLARLEEALAAAPGEPWARLEAAAVAHLELLLGETDYAQVVIRVHPAETPEVSARLVALRDRYEAPFRQLVAALPLPAGTDRGALRLMLLGALNATPSWFRRGRLSAPRLARHYLTLLKEAQCPPLPA